MQTRGSKSRASQSSDDGILDSGLYLDFPERNKDRGGASNNNNNSNSNSSSSNNTTNNNIGGGAFGGAFRRFIKKRPSKIKSQSSSSSEEKAAETKNTTTTNSSNNNNKMTPKNASATTTSKSSTIAKPRRRRGSHTMPEGGGKMPTSTELMMAQEEQQQCCTPSSTTATTTTVQTTKPRQRRGSHAMPEAGAGGDQKLPTSAELIAQKQQNAAAAAPPGESSTAAVPVTMKMGGVKKSGGRRRGSHAMPDLMGGHKMPTSSELIAQNQQAVGGADGSSDGTCGREPMETEELVTATTIKTLAAKSKPSRPRRGSHAMPEGGQMKMPTSAELMAQKEQQQQQQAASSLPQDADKPVTMKMGMSSESSTPRSTSSTHQGQMQHLSVDNNTSMQASNDNGPSPMDTSESPRTPSTKPCGRPRARRRGSVVKTMVDSGPKNVDGDGEHIAGASTEASPVAAQPEALDTIMKFESESMMSIDTDDKKEAASLPQTRPSVEDQEMGNKRPMLKQMSKQISGSPVGESTRNVGAGGKKKDRGRKAIRAVAADLDYVHKVVPKSSDAKELIYDAIKPNILFRACSIEELYDLVDAFEPQHVPMGSVVIQEGDEGDHFYVMEKGGVDVFEKDVHKCSLYSGVAFGEIALLYSCPRTATVQAKYDCKLWVINRRAFRGITAQHKKRRLEMKSDFLKKVKIHDKVLGEILKTSEINSMALATKGQKFKAGNAIVRQGERGDAFYMIEDGKVDVYINEKGARPIVTLQKGSFFGEKALLSSDTRTATCVASTDVKCMLIGREDFVLMLGNLQDLLDRSYIARDEALREKQEASPYPTTRRFDMNDYEIKRTLGVGAFGFVKLVQWKQAPKGKEDQWYALKCVSKQKIEQHKQQEKIKREEDIMKELIHPFIARLYAGMEDEKGKYFLMEALCGGELCELLYNETQFSERWSLFYSASVLSAFGHMHERKVAYRDLKPENLVLDTLGYVKIVDFGLAKKVKSGQTYTFCGTPDYLAPEVILNEGYDWGVDYWGLGVLIYEMTAGVAPFYAESPMEVSQHATTNCCTTFLSLVTLTCAHPIFSIYTLLPLDV